MNTQIAQLTIAKEKAETTIRDAERKAIEIINKAENEAGEKWVSIVNQATEIANRTLELAGSDAPFNFFDSERPIYTNPRVLPAASVYDSVLKDVQLSEGCIVNKAKITRSIIGIRSQVGSGTRIKDTVMMGADYYSLPAMRGTDVPIGIGPNCIIEGAILDKNVRIGEGVIIKPFPRGTEMDAGTWVVQDGIVVIPKDTTILPNTRIAP